MNLTPDAISLLLREKHGLDAVLAMNMSQYAAARDAIVREYGADQPQTSQYEAPSATEVYEPPAAAPVQSDPLAGLDPNSDEYFHAWRQQRSAGASQTGRSPSGGFGRTGYSNSNVQAPTRVSSAVGIAQANAERDATERARMSGLRAESMSNYRSVGDARDGAF